MDVLILVGGFTVFCTAGHAGRLCARDLRRSSPRSGSICRSKRSCCKISDGMDELLAAGDPVLHPGRRHHGRRRHGRAPRQSRQGLRRLHPRRPGARQHPGLDHVRLHLGLFGRRHRLDRLGDDPADDQERLSAPVRGQCHDLRLAAAAADPALAQRRDLFARRRRHDLGRASVHGRRHTRAAARPVADDPVL